MQCIVYSLATDTLSVQVKLACSRKVSSILDLPYFPSRICFLLQGLLKHEGKAKYGSAYHQWQVDAPNFNIDGHYPVRELWERARSCWTRILPHDSRSILVVAHNAVNQALVATAIGTPSFYSSNLIKVHDSHFMLRTIQVFFLPLCQSGLGTEYFRVLLQSNCGVSVLDFTPKPEGGSPNICLNRLNQVKIKCIKEDQNQE